jgi:hypothetical protein
MSHDFGKRFINYCASRSKPPFFTFDCGFETCNVLRCLRAVPERPLMFRYSSNLFDKLLSFALKTAIF